LKGLLDFSLYIEKGEEIEKGVQIEKLRKVYELRKVSSVLSQKELNIFVRIYIYIHTHTHTHTYIYICSSALTFVNWHKVPGADLSSSLGTSVALTSSRRWIKWTRQTFSKKSKRNSQNPKTLGTSKQGTQSQKFLDIVPLFSTQKKKQGTQSQKSWI
jgi:hypothetical protein